MDSLFYVARAVKAEDLKQQVFVKVLVDGPLSLYAAGAGIRYRLSGRNRFVLDLRYGSDKVWAPQREPLGNPEPRQVSYSGLQITSGISL